jgi:hypothetical protein
MAKSPKSRCEKVDAEIVKCLPGGERFVWLWCVQFSDRVGLLFMY